jgi:hypothetical protein
LIPLAIQFGTGATDSWNDVGIFPFCSGSAASSSASQYADCDDSESNPSKRRFSPGLDYFMFISSILLLAGPMRLCLEIILMGMFFYLVFWTAKQSSAGHLAANNYTAVLYLWLDLVAFHQPE